MEYFRIEQMYVDFDLDRRQLLYEIEQKKLMVSIGLAFISGRLGQGTVKVYEEKSDAFSGEVIKKYIPHNGFVELYDTSFVQPSKNLADLLNGETLIVWKIKYNGRECFLEPAIHISSVNCYMHCSEVNKIKKKKLTPVIQQDVVSEALIQKIFPTLNKDDFLMKSSKLAMICWEKLYDALFAIGCTNVTLDLKGEKDHREFTATHQTLTTRAKNYQAFRTRLPSIIQYYLSITKN